MLDEKIQATYDQGVVTECGHIGYPDAIPILGDCTADCGKCGRRVKIVRKAKPLDVLASITGQMVPLQYDKPTADDEPPF